MIFRSILFWFYLCISSLVLFPVAVAIWLTTVFFDSRLRLLHRFSCWWAAHYLSLFPFWRLHIENSELIDNAQPSIILANHQSMGDILALFGLHKHFKWVAKVSLFQIPLIGWNMRLNRYVAINRGGLKSTKHMMHDCNAHLTNGSSVLIFPEGTRSLTGEMRNFKSGSFRLACSAKVPIIPVVIDGTFEALPKSGWMFQQKEPLKITVRVLPPIDPCDYSYNAKELSDTVYHLMQSELARLRTPLDSLSATSA